MEQVKALDALEPFLALAKSATSPRAAADLVTRATSHPNTFLFTELLQTPQIQALSSSDEFAPFLAILQIFSRGTYSAYNATANLPPLNPTQTLKLRQLSLLTHAKDRVLAYSDLISVLGLSSNSELEEIVISAVYASLLNATLDPARETVQVHSVSSLRDVDPQSVPDLLSSLQTWSAACESTLADLDQQIAAVRQRANLRAEETRESEARVKKLVEDEKQAIAGEGAGTSTTRFQQALGGHEDSRSRGLPGRRSGGGVHMTGPNTRYGKRGIGHMDTAPGEVDDEAMDLDDEDDADGKKRNSKRKLQV